MTRKVAIYTRVSTTDQNCERQVRDLEAWAARMGWIVVLRHTEQASGAKADRAERNKLIAAARKGRFDAILVTEMSRWSRSLLDLVTTLQTMSEKGVSLLTLNGVSIDMTNASGRLLAQLVGAFAEFERELIQERIRSGIANNRAKGLSVGGRRLGDCPAIRKHGDAVRRLRAQDTPIRDIAKALRISTTTVQRALKADSATVHTA